MNLIRRIFGTKKNLYTLWPFLVIIAKILRYTILKKTLVDAGIGYKMLPSILTKTNEIQLFDASESSGAVGNAGWFFEKLNIVGLTSYEGFEVFITLIWNLIIIGMFSKCKSKYNKLESTFLVVSILALNIFDFALAKEPVQILYFVVIFYLLQERKKWKEFHYLFVSLIVIALSVLTFRNYYILLVAWTGCLYFIFHFFENKEITFRRVIILIVGVAIFYFGMMYMMQILSPSTFTEFIRVRTRASSATTEITSFVRSDSIVMFTINFLFIIIRILFPVELMRFGIKYAIYVVVQLIISLMMIKSVVNIKHLKSNEKVALYIMLAFVIMSAFFEPDFGSWIRHEIAIFPMFLVAGSFLKRPNYSFTGKVEIKIE